LVLLECIVTFHAICSTSKTYINKFSLLWFYFGNVGSCMYWSHVPNEEDNILSSLNWLYCRFWMLCLWVCIDSLLSTFRFGRITFYLLWIDYIANPECYVFKYLSTDVLCLLFLVIALMSCCLLDSYFNIMSVKPKIDIVKNTVAFL